MKLLDYIRGENRGRAAHRIELEAMTDAFLNESLEGYGAVEGDHAEALERLLNTVRERTESKSRWPIVYWTAAVTGFVCVLGGGIYYMLCSSGAGRDPGWRDAPGLLAAIIGQGPDRAEPRYDIADEVSYEAVAEPDSTFTLSLPPIADRTEAQPAGSEEVSDRFPRAQQPLPASDKTPVPPPGQRVAAADAASVPSSSKPAEHAARTVVPAAENAAAVRKTDAARQPDMASRSGLAPSAAASAASTVVAAAPAGQVPPLEKQTSVQASSGGVSGRVTDAKGQPLENVMVISERKQLGVMTDRNGHFRMDNLPESDQLVVALFGYESHRINVPKSPAPITIVMRESSAGNDEIVIEGYGTLKKSETSGSVATMNPETQPSEGETP